MRLNVSDDNKNKLISAASTALIMALIVVICLCESFGYHPPDPPIPEEGVEVALGFNESGSGNNPSLAAQPNQAAPAASNNFSTQSSEQSVSMNSDSRGSKTNPNATASPEPESKAPEINQKALFKGRSNSNNGSTGQGNTSGTGLQGDPNGTPGSDNYSGTPGNGGMVNLKGRRAVSLPAPSYNSAKQGKVVVKIWVNQQGTVVKAESGWKGSTTTDPQLIEQARSAALKTKFDAAPAAAVQQTGTITYVFQRTN